MQAHLCHPLLRSPAMDVVKVTYYFITTGIPINTSERHSSNSKLTVVWPMKSTTYLCCAAMAEKLSEKLHLHCTGCNIFVDWYGMPSSLCSLATNGIIFQALFSSSTTTSAAGSLSLTPPPPPQPSAWSWNFIYWSSFHLAAHIAAHRHTGCILFLCPANLHSQRFLPHCHFLIE